MIEQTLQQLFEHYGQVPPTRARVKETGDLGKGYWCSVKPCYADGREKPQEPLIERIIIDPMIQGRKRGLYALPQVGSLVRVGFYGGSIHDPYLDAVLAQGEVLDSVNVDEILFQHNENSYWKILADGSWQVKTPQSTRQIDGHEETTVEAGTITQSPQNSQWGITENGKLLIAQTQSGGSLAAWLRALLSEVENLRMSLDNTLEAIQRIYVPTGTGPSGEPINSAEFVQIADQETLEIKKKLKQLKTKLSKLLRA